MYSNILPADICRYNDIGLHLYTHLPEIVPLKVGMKSLALDRDWITRGLVLSEVRFGDALIIPESACVPRRVIMRFVPDLRVNTDCEARFISAEMICSLPSA